MQDNKNIEQFKDEWRKDSANKDGQKYFEDLIYSLERELKEVKEHQESFEKAIKDQNHHDKINHIEWCSHRIQQINLHHEKAIRAASKISRAFNLDLL